MFVRCWMLKLSSSLWKWQTYERGGGGHVCSPLQVFQVKWAQSPPENHFSGSHRLVSVLCETLLRRRDASSVPSDMHCVYMEAARHPSCSAGRPANGNVHRKLMKAAEWAHVCAERRRRGGRRITVHEFHFTGWHFCYLGECSQINLPLLCRLIGRRRDVNKDADKPWKAIKNKWSLDREASEKEIKGSRAAFAAAASVCSFWLELLWTFWAPSWGVITLNG